MTREKEIRLEIDLRLAGCYGDYSEGYEEGFIAGAKWADETMIEKAKKWIENFLEKTIQKPSINDGYTSDSIDLVEFRRHRLIEEVLYDFKISMES